MVDRRRRYRATSQSGSRQIRALIAADPDVRYLVLGGWDDLTPRAPASFILGDYLLVSAGPASLGLSQALTDRGHQRCVGKNLRCFSLCPVLPCHGNKATPDCAPLGTPARQRVESHRACQKCGNPGRRSVDTGALIAADPDTTLVLWHAAFVVTRHGRWKVSTATTSDQMTWRRLYRAYGEEAGYLVSDEHLSRVWSWIMRNDGQTNCLLLHSSTAPDAVGLAHYRPFERPITGSIGCYLDDLFVDTVQRGHGGARALLEHLAGLAGASGWTTVRWTTKPSNPAQSLYNSVAARSPVITFDMDPRVD